MTLAFDVFWNWLLAHPNCILRASTPECVLYDDEDLHWHFAAEGAEVQLVQLLRGKRLLGELFVNPDDVSYVEIGPGEADGEHLFELIAEGEAERVAVISFVLAHAYETGEFTPGHVH